MPPEQPQDETAEVATIDDLLPLAIELPEPRRVVGTDGMAVEIVARSGANHVSRELWSPTQSREPEAHELVRRALALAQGSLCEAASHRRLEELETHLVRVRGVPFAMGLWSSQQSLVQFRDRAGSAP